MRVSANDDWLDTPLGERRGYIQPHTLSELWFHTGTACNLACPFCFEGSKPGDRRLGRVTLGDVRPFVDEAVELGVHQFSFTGGEPFVNRDFVRILAYALDRAPCLVLSNGVDVVTQRLAQIEPLRASAHPLAFRISIDHPTRRCTTRARRGQLREGLDGIARTAHARLQDLDRAPDGAR